MAPVGRFAAVISLQGIEDVYAKLKGLGPAGEQAMRSLDSAVQNVNLDGLGQSVTRASGAVGEFRDSLHILHPILRVAGIEMGNFTAFSRAAGAGVLGLGAAIAGAALIGLIKLSSNVQEAKNKLQLLFRDKATADKFFADLQKNADRTSTPIQNLIPIVEQLIKTEDELANRPGKAKFVSITDTIVGTDGTRVVKEWAAGVSLAVVKSDVLAKAVSNLNTIFLNAGESQDKSTQAINKFLADAGKTDKITGDMVRNLREASKIGADALARFVGKGSAAAWAAELDKMSISYSKFTNDIGNKSKTIERAVDTLPQALDKLKVALVNALTPPPGLASEIVKLFNDMAKGYNDFAKAMQIFDQSKNKGELLKGLGVALIEGILKELTDGSADFLAKVAAWAQPLTDIFTNLTWDDVFGGIGDAFGRAIQSARDTWDQFVEKLKSDWQNFLSFLSSNPANLNVSGTGGSIVAPTGAQGGLLRGPGTSTSDSILARLSAGEFVVKAKAVQWYGADLLRAINSMRLPRDFMRGFNMGGLVDDMVRALVPGSLPRFAAGGMATANMRPVILNINGQQFGGLQGTQDAVSQLERYAVISNLRATGRSPGWNK